MATRKGMARLYEEDIWNLKEIAAEKKFRTIADVVQYIVNERKTKGRRAREDLW